MQNKCGTASAEAPSNLDQNGDWKGRVAGTPVEDEGFICMGGKAPICPQGLNNLNGDWQGRIAGTPVLDEGFICMGSKAPICPPQVIEPVGPVTLDAIQGSWVGSSGSSISVSGTEVFINGLPLTQHRVQLDDDGVVVSIGTLWQLEKWGEGGSIEFRASSTRENMLCARSETWSKKSASGEEWQEKMKSLGYAGSSANPLARGVEGCLPGTLGAEMRDGYATSKDKRDTTLLCALLSQWREQELQAVRPRSVIPDFTNRSQTGLGVELVHFVASSIYDKGFKKRVGKKGHDIPVLVREVPGSYFHGEALRVWKERVGEEEGFPPVRADESQEIFTSLGNGHFFQALNCYDCGCKGINDGRTYTVRNDKLLKEALEDGVPSIILKHQTPKPVRAKIADLLNAKREFQWSLGEDGQVDLSQEMEEDTSQCSHFEWLSKGMDAEQVNCLVRTHLGIKESKRILG
jgi:hypothetical protein